MISSGLSAILVMVDLDPGAGNLLFFFFSSEGKDEWIEPRVVCVCLQPFEKEKKKRTKPRPTRASRGELSRVRVGFWVLCGRMEEL